MITNLPIYSVLDELKSALEDRDEAVLEAPPGAGKTTIVPIEFLEVEWLQGQTILVLEPRRIATRNAAQRMAELLGESVGERVGYRMRLESKISRQTRIEVITEGILGRMLMDDPSLAGVGMVIFDEFHERSLDADLGLALCLKSREIFRETPLKILLMSATLEGLRLADLLHQAPVISSKGQAWPVDIVYGSAAQPRDKIIDRVVTTIHSALKQHPDSSLLVFLPGEGEIRRVADRLETDSNTHVAPLYGQLSLADQRLAIAPVAKTGQRKVVLATNIAETSLTIEGVDVVIDSGLERNSRFDPNTAMTRLQTEKISQSSATQRAGRAGRMRAGTCYRLWSEEQQRQLAPHGSPEILNADLSAMALQLLQWGIDDPEELSWLDPPPRGGWQQALTLLTELGALTMQQTTGLTAHGELMAQLALTPRLAHMLIRGAEINAAQTAAALASLLSDRDPFSGRDNYRPDIQQRVDILLNKAPCPSQHQGWKNRTLQLAERYQHQLERLPIQSCNEVAKDSLTGYLVACAFPDRISRRRHAGGYQLANGRSANFASADSLNKHRWLAVAEVGGIARRKGDMIRTAAVLDSSLFDGILSEMQSHQTKVEWDKKSGRFVAEEQTCIGQLVIERTPLLKVPETEKISAICDLIRTEGMTLFKAFAEFCTYRNRTALIRQHIDPSWPNLDDSALLESLEAWLGPYLTPIKKLDELKKLDLVQIWQDRLGHQRQQTLKQLVPVTISVPSGSSIRIDYRENPPVLAVKLQEMFGLDQTPSILDGKVSLLCHLLSPAGRPLQVTQDLAGFWRSSYQEVKKEMKGRYPKHPWPDDPTVAVATRYTQQRS
jgi:ATP-dependent helicase HrpB